MPSPAGLGSGCQPSEGVTIRLPVPEARKGPAHLQNLGHLQPTSQAARRSLPTLLAETADTASEEMRSDSERRTSNGVESREGAGLADDELVCCCWSARPDAVDLQAGDALRWLSRCAEGVSNQRRALPNES